MFNQRKSKKSPSNRRKNDQLDAPVTQWYLVIGALLGIGCPLGAILLRILMMPHENWVAWLQGEFDAYRWFYAYMAFGSVVVFTFGSWLVAVIHRHLNVRAHYMGIRIRALEALSVKDAQTGLYNFGTMQNYLELEMEQAQKDHTPLSVLMIDVDNLKETNDHHGHQAGDTVIRYIADCLRATVRSTDLTARYGGDEFFMILPDTPEIGGAVVAERIRKRINEGKATFEDQLLQTSVSIGIAEYNFDEMTSSDLLVRAADRALYHAKQQGKNSMDVYHPQPTMRLSDDLPPMNPHVD